MEVEFTLTYENFAYYEKLIISEEEITWSITPSNEENKKSVIIKTFIDEDNIEFLLSFLEENEIYNENYKFSYHFIDDNSMKIYKRVFKVSNIYRVLKEAKVTPLFLSEFKDFNSIVNYFNNYETPKCTKLVLEYCNNARFRYNVIIEKIVISEDKIEYYSSMYKKDSSNIQAYKISDDDEYIKDNKFISFDKDIDFEEIKKLWKLFSETEDLGCDMPFLSVNFINNNEIYNLCFDLDFDNNYLLVFKDYIYDKFLKGTNISPLFLASSYKEYNKLVKAIAKKK